MHAMHGSLNKEFDKEVQNNGIGYKIRATIIVGCHNEICENENEASADVDTATHIHKPVLVKTVMNHTKLCVGGRHESLFLW